MPVGRPGQLRFLGSIPELSPARLFVEPPQIRIVRRHERPARIHRRLREAPPDFSRRRIESIQVWMLPPDACACACSRPEIRIEHLCNRPWTIGPKLVLPLPSTQPHLAACFDARVRIGIPKHRIHFGFKTRRPSYQSTLQVSAVSVPQM